MVSAPRADTHAVHCFKLQNLKLCCGVPAQTNACLMLKAPSVLALHLEDCSRVLLAENAPRNGSLTCHVPLVTQTSQSQFQLLASTLQSTTLIKCNPCCIEKRSASQQWQCALFRCCRPIDSLSATLIERPHAHFLSHGSSSMMQIHVATCYLHTPTHLQTQRLRRHAQRPRVW